MNDDMWNVFGIEGRCVHKTVQEEVLESEAEASVHEVL